jgi:hypothetical protein
MTKSDRLGNKILERLPKHDFQKIVGQMEKVTPDVGEVVAYPDKEPKWVHFPISGVLSSMVVLEDGSTVEASTVGNEGMDGLYLLADPLANPYSIKVQVLQAGAIREPCVVTVAAEILVSADPARSAEWGLHPTPYD